MNRKKDLQHLHVRIKPETSNKLKAWADELGLSLGETIDQVVDGYEHFCNTQDNNSGRDDVLSILDSLMEKVNTINSKLQ